MSYDHPVLYESVSYSKWWRILKDLFWDGTNMLNETDLVSPPEDPFHLRQDVGQVAGAKGQTHLEQCVPSSLSNISCTWLEEVTHFQEDSKTTQM